MITRRCDLSEILPIRHAVLREGKPLETAIFDGDHDKNTLHFGLFDGDRVISCLTLMATKLEMSGSPTADAWQLRGMATDAEFQGRGLGGRLMRDAMRDALKEGYSNLFWCNARLVAVPFYIKHGWETTSGEFNITGIGPHYKMMVELR